MKFLVFSVLLPVSLVAAPHPDWAVTTVVNDLNLDVFHSLAVDPAGNPASSFVDKNQRQLKLARWSGNSWSRETIDAGNGSLDLGSFNSLRFSATGLPAVAYRRYNSGASLHYAAFDGNLWSLTPIATAGDTPLWTSLAFSPSGQPAIAFRNSSSRLAFAELSGSWSIDPNVGGSAPTGDNASLAFHPATGRPAIACWSTASRQIRFVEKGALFWEPPVTIATLAVDANADPSLAFSSAGNPCVAFRDASAGQLRFAERIDGSWTIVNVAPVSISSLSEGLELRFNPITGEPAIVFTDPATFDLNYATRSDAVWTITTIDPDGETGRYPKLDFSSSGQAHITYLFNAGGSNRLKHATPRPAPPPFSSFAETNRTAWSPNMGWVNFSRTTPAGTAGVIIGERFLAGEAWAPNIGWIRFGDGLPDNGTFYTNNSATNYGVNRTPIGKLFGYAWAPNIGWIHFNEPSGDPRINLATGSLSGYAWAPNLGWIHLANLTAATLDTRDADGDGIPDDLERVSFGNLSSASALSDKDGDGVSDAVELTSGSDPTNPGVWFRIVSQQTAAGLTSTTIEFTSAVSRFYQIHTSTNLTTWTPDTTQHGIFQGEQGTTTRTLTHPAESQLFFTVYGRLPLAE